MRRKRRSARKPPVLRSSGASQTVKHNASRVLWCMQKGSSEETRMTEFGFAEEFHRFLVSVPLIPDTNLYMPNS